MIRLLLTLLFLSGCVTSPWVDMGEGHDPRKFEADCKIENFESYWGDCWYEKMEPYIPNMLHNQKVYGATNSWYKLRNVIMENRIYLERGDIDYVEANRRFEKQLQESRDEDKKKMQEYIALTAEQKAQEKQRWQDLADALGEANRIQSGGNNPAVIGGADAPQRLSRTELKNDGGKICHYGFGLTAKTLVVGLGGKCPDYL